MSRISMCGDVLFYDCGRIICIISQCRFCSEENFCSCQINSDPVVSQNKFDCFTIASDDLDIGMQRNHNFIIHSFERKKKESVFLQQYPSPDEIVTNFNT